MARGDGTLEARQNELARVAFSHCDLGALVTHTRIPEACISAHRRRVSELPRACRKPINSRMKVGRMAARGALDGRCRVQGGPDEIPQLNNDLGGRGFDVPAICKHRIAYSPKDIPCLPAH